MPKQLSLLQAIEPRLRRLLPENLYNAAWVDPESKQVLMPVADHLRALYRTLYASLPLQVTERNLQAGEWHAQWVNGTLMLGVFGGLPGADADATYQQLNRLWDDLRTLIGEAGGQVQWLDGRTFLVVFEENAYDAHIEQAVRGAARMMQQEKGAVTLRLALHSGRVLTAHVGTPLRMAYIVAGSTLQTLRTVMLQLEVGQIGLTEAIYDVVKAHYRAQSRINGITVINLPEGETQADRDDFEISAFRSRRSTSHLMVDISTEGMVQAITDSLNQIDPLAAYLSQPLLRALVHAPTKTLIAPTQREMVLLELRIAGLLEGLNAEVALPEDWLRHTSQAFARISSLIEAEEGIIVQQDSLGLAAVRVVAAFGLLGAPPPADRIAQMALTLREALQNMLAPSPEREKLSLSMQLRRQSVGVLELGQPRSRRDWLLVGNPFDVLADAPAANAGDIVLDAAFAAQLGTGFTRTPYADNADNADNGTTSADGAGLFLLQGHTESQPTPTRKNIDIRL